MREDRLLQPFVSDQMITCEPIGHPKLLGQTFLCNLQGFEQILIAIQGG